MPFTRKEPVGPTPAEQYAKPRKLNVLSKKDGKQLVELLEKSGVKILHKVFDKFSVIEIRDGRKIVTE